MANLTPQMLFSMLILHPDPKRAMLETFKSNLDGQNFLSWKEETLKGAKMTIFKPKFAYLAILAPLNGISHANFTTWPQEGNTRDSSGRGENFNLQNLAYQVSSIAFLRSGCEISMKNANWGSKGLNMRFWLKIVIFCPFRISSLQERKFWPSKVGLKCL